MKVKFLAFICAFLISLPSFAQFFPARTQMSVFPGQVSVTVFNPFPRAIVCSGQVFGQTMYGQVLTSFFMNQFMMPGEFRYAFVYTNPFNPFMNGWSNINCQFAGWF